MGQTQILFIVLSVIIVGVAVAVGITQFNSSAIEANRNALILDCQSIVASAQQWYRKPASLGGGGNKFDGLTLTKIGVDSTNANGSFEVTTASGTDLVVEATGTEIDPATSAPIKVKMTYDATTGDMTTE